MNRIYLIGGIGVVVIVIAIALSYSVNQIDGRAVKEGGLPASEEAAAAQSEDVKVPPGEARPSQVVKKLAPPEFDVVRVNPRGDAANLPVADALNERVLGNSSAPITIIEYASMTCFHCKSFHEDVLPSLMTAYIETGKAKLIFRDFPLDGLALRASMMARCAPADRYFKYIDVLFRTQSTWATNTDPLVALARVGKLGGMNQAGFDSCMENEALFDGILRSRQVAAIEFSVQSTPTFIINGKKLTQQPTFESFESILKRLAP